MKKISGVKLKDLASVAKSILDEFGKTNVFAFYGKMGAGKTTLIKAFCTELGVDEVVTSPTFALVNEYLDKDSHPVYHFDFYRIKKLDEVFDIGYEEYFYSNSYCFIEWPELIEDLLPESYIKISIEEIVADSRVITATQVNSNI